MISRNYNRVAFLIGSIFTLLVVMASANASTITIHLTGSVTDWDGGLGSQFSVGDALNMQYSYASDAVDVAPDSSGSYYLDDFSGTLGSYAFGFGSGFMTLYPSPSPFGDQIFVTGNVTGNDVAGASLAVGSAWYRDYDGTTFVDDSLITFAPDLSEMEAYGFFLRFDTPGAGPLIVRSSIDSVRLTTTSVPEPASAMLLAMGLLLFGLVQREKKRSELKRCV